MLLEYALGSQVSSSAVGRSKGDDVAAAYCRGLGRGWEKRMALFKAEKKEFKKNAGKWDVVVSEDMCKACGFCLHICPVDVFAWRKSQNQLGWVPMYVAKEANCIGCMLCYQICPDFCIDVSPKASDIQGQTSTVEAPMATRDV